MKTRILLAGLAVCGGLTAFADSLTQSTFTEVINDVNVVVPSTHAATPAKVNELFKTPDLVRTGPESRTELTAPDQTITRVGANTVFSFEPEGRNLNLEKGSILFHSPSGKGGGTIKSGGAAAAVLGTTIIVAASENGGFKVIVLEGKGKVTLPGGKTAHLNAGQLIFVLPGQSTFGPKLDINLGKLVAGSQLVNGFSHPLSSLPLIQQAIGRQNKEIAKGRAQDTGITANQIAGGPLVGNGLDALDNHTYQSAVNTPLTAAQLQLITGVGVAAPARPNLGGSGVVLVSP
jgi:FecR protein